MTVINEWATPRGTLPGRIETVRVSELEKGDVVIADGVIGTVTMLDEFAMAYANVPGGAVVHTSTSSGFWPVIRIFIGAGDKASHGIARFPDEYIQRIRRSNS